MSITYLVTNTKLEKFSQANNTPWDIAYKKLQPFDCSLCQIEMLFCFEFGLRGGQQDALADCAKFVSVGFVWSDADVGEALISDANLLLTKVVAQSFDTAEVVVFCAEFEEDSEHKEHYTTTVEVIQEKLSKIEIEIAKVKRNLSNLTSTVDEVVATCCKLGGLWSNSELELCQKIQNMLFPSGIFGDKKTNDGKIVTRPNL